MFDNTFKDLLFSTFLRYMTSELQQKIIEINNYKTIYSLLNRYYKLKIKQLKNLSPSTITYNEYTDSNELKISIFGEEGVGKSTIAFSYIDNKSSEETNLFTKDFSKRQIKMLDSDKIIEVDENKNILGILDIATRENEKPLRDDEYKYTNCILTICDLTNRSSLNEVKNNIINFYKAKESNNAPVVIVGNKLDLIEQENYKREITKEMIDELIENVCKGSKLKPVYIETSAKTGFNIEKVFCAAARLTHNAFIDWNHVIKRLLNGENLFKEFESTKSQKCILM
ncbi:hypothetical protein ABK040_006890 [Willaertia magna]